MGQFKPMVKMETTEPSVILHLKKGGSAKMPVRKMDGGAMGAAGPVTPVANPAAARAMAAQRMARRPAPMTNPTAPGRPAIHAMPMGRPMMKEGGSMDKAQDKAMVKKAFKQHDAQEHKGGKGTKLKLAAGGMAGKCATGGVVNGQGGYKAGGKVSTARPDTSPAKTGEVKLGNGGGYKEGGKAMMGGGMSGYATGGVAKSNGGGYRKGGAAKKFAEGGRVQDDGGPEQMKQGRKPMPAPVAISMLSGTYKKGGDVSASKLRAVNKAEFAPTMKAATKDSNEKYGPSRNFMNKAGGAC
jgi:hypothetical protein